MLPNLPVPCCVLCFLCRLRPIVRYLLIVTFDGKFSQLTLSYLAKKDHPSDNVTRCGVTFHLNIILFLYISSTSTPLTFKYIFFYKNLNLRLLPPNIYFLRTLPNEPNMGAAKASIGKNLLLCLQLFRLPLMYQAPCLTNCFFILKSCCLLVQCYMFCDLNLAPVAITHTNNH